MKRNFTEERIIGFLSKAQAGLQIKELHRRHGFSETSDYLGTASSQRRARQKPTD